MKTRKYTTSGSGFFVESDIYALNDKMSGILTLTCDESPAQEGFNGFGVALTGSSCWQLNTMEPSARERLLDDIYGKDGLNLSVARLSIGSSDYSAELYSYDETPNDLTLKDFSISRDEEYIIPMIKEVVKKRDDLLVFASPWSPPGWMKTGGNMCGGYMRDKYIDCYADYFIRYIEEYRKHGINIDFISPQNEIENQQSGRMAACAWHPETEVNFVLALKKKLREKNFNTEIWMFDHFFVCWQRVIWQFSEYPELFDACNSIAMHYYDGFAEIVKEMKKVHPKLKYHFTEGGPRLNDLYASDYCKWAIMMSKVLSNGYETFIGWNLVLDELGGPNIGPFFCGGLVTLNSTTKELSYSGQYRAFKHFSKFIQRGAKVHKSSAFSGPLMSAYPRIKKDCETCVVTNPDGSHIVEIVNPNEAKAQFQYFYKGKWWYIEVMPESVVTVCFDSENK